MRLERVSTRGKVRDALHIGVEIPVKFLIGALILAAFNAGVVWVQFGALVKSTEALQDRLGETRTTVTKIEQHNGYQDNLLQDHETRIRSVERKTK